MRLSEQALAILATGYRWTAEDHRLVIEEFLRVRARYLERRALDLRSHVGYKLCNQHGMSCRDVRSGVKWSEE